VLTETEMNCRDGYKDDKNEEALEKNGTNDVNGPMKGAEKDTEIEEVLEKNGTKDVDGPMKDAEKDTENEKTMTPSNAEEAKEGNKAA
jgi:hypothetical protein